MCRWVTRLPGCQDRLLEMLRKLWERARKAGFCPVCGTTRGIFKVKKRGKNIGRLFVNCSNRCDGAFDWI